jgi:hypothetical protein
MRPMRPRNVGRAFALLAVVLWFVELLLDGIGSLSSALGGRAGGADAFGEALLAGVLGVLTLGFTVMGSSRGRSEARVAGVLFVVLALAEWLIVRAAAPVVGLLATLLTLLAGVLYLLDVE